MPAWAVALMTGAGGALVGLVAKTARQMRFGKREDEDIISRAANQAVEAVSGALNSLREERRTDQQVIERLNRTIEQKAQEATDLRKELGEVRQELTDALQEIDNLNSKVHSLEVQNGSSH